MSTVHIHVGQCGNQIGNEFWMKACSASTFDENTKRAFLTPSGPGRNEGGHMRAVFVDSEKKVLQKIIGNGKLQRKGANGLRLGYGNVVSCAKGCGSNWSRGYHELPEQLVSRGWDTNVCSYTHDFAFGDENSILKTTMEVIRREVEDCDCFSGFVLWHSLAGGTGSGFGSRLSAELREKYHVAYQMNVTVSPMAAGESPMQPYNELLCLAGLQQDSDAIVVFENDEIIDLIESRNRTDSASFAEMNSYIADCMLNLLSPVSSLTPPKGPTVGIEPWELVRSVAPMHNLKFLHCRCIEGKKSQGSAPSETWDTIGNKLCQQLRSKFLKTKSFTDCEESTLAALCVCRDVNKSKRFQARDPVDIAKLASKLRKTYDCAAWNPFPVDVWVDETSSKNERPQVRRKSLTTCANLSSYGTHHCANLLKSAKVKFDAKAYLHWYAKHGTSETEFKEAFEIVSNIVSEYSEAAAS